MWVESKECAHHCGGLHSIPMCGGPKSKKRTGTTASRAASKKGKRVRDGKRCVGRRSVAEGLVPDKPTFIAGSLSRGTGEVTRGHDLKVKHFSKKENFRDFTTQLSAECKRL